MSSSLDSNVDALLGLANQAVGAASSLTGRIVRTDFEAAKAAKVRVDAPSIARPDTLSAALGGHAFNHAPTIVSPDKPRDTSGTYSVDPFRFDVAKPAMAKPAELTGLEPTDTSAATLKWLDGETDKWYAKFFPELDACLKTEPERWLCGIITGQKPFGMAEEVFRAVWHQARDREYRARNSAVETLRMEHSARGFALPSGALVSAIGKAEEAASDAIAGVNVAQAIRDSEIKLDLLKFAEEQAIKLKLGVMQALADFYRQWLTLPDKGYEMVRVKAQAYEALNRALSEYYRVELGFEELRMKAAELRSTGSLSVAKLNLDAYSTFQQALSEFNRGQIGIEELKLRAAETQARVGMDGSQLQVTAYSAFQRAMSDYNSGRINVAELKLRAAEIEARADAGLKESAQSSTARAHAAFNASVGESVRAFGDLAGQAASGAGTLVAEITSL